jgi:hypothetical protein
MIKWLLKLLDKASDPIQNRKLIEYEYQVKTYVREYILTNGDRIKSKEFSNQDYSGDILDSSCSGFFVSEDGYHFNRDSIFCFKDILIREETRKQYV